MRKGIDFREFTNTGLTDVILIVLVFTIFTYGGFITKSTLYWRFSCCYFGEFNHYSSPYSDCGFLIFFQSLLRTSRWRRKNSVGNL
mgnify:CR=1 FL=1